MTVPDIFDVYAGTLDADSKEKYEKLAKEMIYNSSHWQFEVIDGIFKQSGTVDPLKFDYMEEDFGRILSWEEIFSKLKELNENSESNECYKILFLARHGQGWHNVCNSKYGQEEWDEKWCNLNTDGEIVWGPDPKLTPIGIKQAKGNNECWKLQISQGCKIPTKWFCSPMSRSIDTLINTWDNLVDLKQCKPLIMENLRETTGVLSDMRLSRVGIKKKYGPVGFEIESNFPENDLSYTEPYESISHHLIRINKSLQYIFDNHDDEIINITSHSGSIRSQLLVLNHRPFAIGTGGMIPVFVKATKVEK